MKKQYEFGTLAIHAGQEPDPSTGAIMTPIFQTSTYVQPALGEHKGYEYSRTKNPTRSAYEACVAALESGADGKAFGAAFASGCAATATLLHLLQPGDHVVASDDLYGGTFRQFDKVFAADGASFLQIDDLQHRVRGSFDPYHFCVRFEGFTVGLFIRHIHERKLHTFPSGCENFIELAESATV